MVNTLITFFLDVVTRLLVMASVYSIAYLAWVIYQQRQAVQRKTYTSRSHQAPPNRLAYYEVRPETERRLLGMVGGDRKLAQTLVSVARRGGKTEQWAWEKAIYDLERDRR